MKLTIGQPTLSALLTRVTKAVESRQTIPILGNVLLTASGNTLTAVATDLDVEVTSTAEANVTQEGSTTVSATTLQAIVAKLNKGKEVSLDAQDLTLTITSGRSNLSLAALPIDDFPRIASESYEAEIQTDQTEIKRLLDLTSFAMSTEETRYYLNGVYLHSVEGNVRAVSTDGHRLAKVDADLPAQFPGVIIPKKTVAMLRGLLDEGDVSVSISATKIRVDCGHTVVVSKVIDGAFPDYTRIIPQSHKSEVTVSASDVKQASALVSLVSGEKVRAVKVKADGDTLSLTVRSGADVGIEEVECALVGDPVEAGVNAKYLADILQACNGDNAVLRFDGSMTAIVIQPEEDSRAIYLVMPLRV